MNIKKEILFICCSLILVGKSYALEDFPLLYVEREVGWCNGVDLKNLKLEEETNDFGVCKILDGNWQESILALDF